MTVAYMIEIEGRRVPARYATAVTAAHVAAALAAERGLTVDTDVRVTAMFDR